MSESAEPGRANLSGQVKTGETGAMSKGQLANRTAVALASQLGVRVAEFPGDHGGFAALPEPFGRVLDQVLAQSAW